MGSYARILDRGHDKTTRHSVQHSAQARYSIAHLMFEAHAAQVRYLKVIEKSGYQALPWVRYITTAGEYEIRMG